ncbi:MAG: DUF1329 domain-containing protein [Thermodesulfobacteriota bacterium]|nr:DUF1329 domain-containing protein [Thermodesulfobacteriota bacterium]
MKKLFVVIIFSICLNGIISAQETLVKPGVVITKGNYKKYISELKSLLPPGPYSHIIDNSVKHGWMTIPVIEKKKYNMPKGFAKATAKNKGKFKVGKGNKIIGKEPWTGGLPFPEPETGPELGWNVVRRRECNREDFQIYFKWLLITKAGITERTFENYFFAKSYTGRTDKKPIPEIIGNNGEIFWKEAMVVINPFDVKGFSMLRIHYEDLYRKDDVFSYIPALRRVRRLTGSDVTDPLLGSDGCYDNFEGWHQKITPEMEFKIVDERNLIVPTYYTKKPPEGYVKKNCLQVDWEIRPHWILNIDVNDPDYAFTRRVFYVEKEDGSSSLAYGECFDQKGRLSRTNYTVILRYYDPATFMRNYWGAMYHDALTGHTTLIPTHPVDTNLGETLISLDTFTVRGLLKKAR